MSNAKSRELLGKKLKTLYKKLGRAPALFECEESGIKERQIRNHFGGITRALMDLGMIPMEEPGLKSEVELRARIGELRRDKFELESKLLEVKAESKSLEDLKAIIHEGKEREHTPPNWLLGDRKAKGVHGIPVLFISDIHFDEVVKPEQVGFANSFNREIAERRLKHTFQSAVRLTKDYLKEAKYDGFVCAFGGDLLSGNIHEELKESNEAAINQSILALTDILIAGVELLASEFDNVFVPCVVGNHGRQSVKPRAKGFVHENFEWLIYQYMERHFRGNKKVQFLIPDGSDAQFSIYGKNYLLTHGNQFRGGTGISGLYTPLMLGMARKQKRNQAIGKPFDTMMVGHWHTYVHTDQLIVNGSVKGVDEYSYQGNFGAERPQQALWIEHPRNGTTFRMPVLCEPGKAFDGANKMKIIF